MRTRTLSCITAMAWFASLAIPVRLAAQERADDEHRAKQHRYKLIDVGTFGGPESFINPSVNGGSDSSRDTTVGSSATSVPAAPQSNTVGVCGGLDGSVPFVFHAFKLQDSGVTDLSALPPAASNCSNAQAINARGEIAGNSENGVVDPVTGIMEIRAVLWKDDEIRELGTFEGNVSQASQINGRGQIVGSALNTIPDPFSIYYFQFFGSLAGTQTRAFLWEEGHMKDLGTLGGPDAAAIFVNERGQVAGASYTNSTPNATTVPTEDPFLWDNGRMIDLGSLGGTLGFPNALNNRGQVVGQSNLAGDQSFDPFLWDGERIIDLATATAGGSPVTANAINDAGEVVGAATFSTDRPYDAYLWRDRVATDLGTLPGDCFSEAFAINSRGQVVGQSIACDFSTRTFLWDKGTMIDLNAFVPPSSGLQLVEAVALNDRGDIRDDLVPTDCGNDAKCGHAFVLIPCNDEHSDKEHCQDADAPAVSARRGSPTPVNQSSVSMTNRGLTPKEIADRMRTQFGRKGVLGTWPRK